MLIFEFRTKPIDREAEPERYAETERRQRQYAAETLFTYEHMRARGIWQSGDEWGEYLQQRGEAAKIEGDPNQFCWALMIAMTLGLDGTKAQREELGAVAERWSHATALLGQFRD